MTRGAWSPDDEPVVGIVTTDATESEMTAGIEDGIRETVESRDGTLVDGSLEDVLGADPSPSVVLVGDDGTLSAVGRAGLRRSSPVPPVLPVGDVTGVESAEPDRLPDALEAVLEGKARVRERTILEVDRPDGGTASAVFDATLVTDEPARISEYDVRRGDREVASFRADGVVVATAAGSRGYASALEGPRLSPAVDGVVVAPIAPFVMDVSRWVLPPPVTLTVARDEGTVAVVADGRSVGTVAVDETVTVSAGGTLRTLVPDGPLESGG